MPSAANDGSASIRIAVKVGSFPAMIKESVELLGIDAGASTQESRTRTGDFYRLKCLFFIDDRALPLPIDGELGDIRPGVMAGRVEVLPLLPHPFVFDCRNRQCFPVDDRRDHPLSVGSRQAGASIRQHLRAVGYYLVQAMRLRLAARHRRSRCPASI